jgi:hypothetical protein
MTKHGKTWFIVALLAIAAVIIHWHINWKRTDTPEYSINQISAICSGRSTEEITTYIDEKALYGDLFDAWVNPVLTEKYHMNASLLMMQARQSIKDRFIADMTAARIAALTHKSLPALHPHAANILASSDLFYWKLYSIDKVTGTNDRAEASVTLQHMDIPEHLQLTLVLRKQDDKPWKVIGFKDSQSFYLAARTVVQKRLDQLNEPMTKEMAEQIRLVSPAWNIATRKVPYISRYFLFTPTLHSSSTQTITQIIGQLQIYDADQQLIFSQKYIEASPLAPGESRQLKISWPLNEEDPEERALIQADPSSLTLNTKLLRLRFADGSVIQLLEALPHTYKKKEGL